MNTHREGSDRQNDDHPAVADFREMREVEPTVSVEDLGTYAGMSIEALASAASESLIEGARERSESEAYFRERYDIPEGEDFAVGMRKFAVRKAREYRQLFEQKREGFIAQAHHCIQLAQTRRYIGQPPKVRVVVTDWFLTYGKRGLTDVASYDHREKTTFILADSPNILLAHEVGHALSHSRERLGERVGFVTYETIREGEEKIHGSQLLNEGATVLWENLSVNDGSTYGQRSWDMDFYTHARDVTAYLLQKLGIPEDIFFQAYFGDADAQRFLEDAMGKAYGCTLEDLNCLGLRLSFDWAKKILDGERVEVTISKQEDASVRAEKEDLGRVFSNVVLVEKD
jgi:hypothetical protein